VVEPPQRQRARLTIGTSLPFASTSVKSPSTTYGPFSRILIVTLIDRSSEDRIFGSVMELPVVGVSRELHRHRVFDIHANVAAAADDLEVFLADRQIEPLSLGENRPGHHLVGLQP